MNSSVSLRHDRFVDRYFFKIGIPLGTPGTCRNYWVQPLKLHTDDVLKVPCCFVARSVREGKLWRDMARNSLRLHKVQGLGLGVQASVFSFRIRI